MDEPLSPPFLADLALTCQAVEYAAARHEGQRRDSDAAPFILHPIEVAVLLRNRGYGDDVVAAAILHDAVEETDATLGDLRSRFGARICSMVAALTEDRSIRDYAARKADLRARVCAADPDVAAIYAADKIAKARELRAQLTRDAGRLEDRAVQDRLAHYAASAEMLDERLPDHPLVRQLQFELWALRALPPAGS